MPDTDRDYLSADDAHILGVESASILGHTLKLVVLEPGEPVDIDALRNTVAERVPLQPRASERVDTTDGQPRWVSVSDFDVTHHVRRYPENCATTAELWSAVSGLMSQHLDREYPLWTFDVIGPLADGRQAIAARIHHAMFDGMAAVHFLDDVLFDVHDEQTNSRVGVRADAAPSRVTEARRLPGAVVRELGHRGSSSPFDRPITASRELAFAVAPLAEMKSIGASRPQRATVNDVLLTVVAGGLRTWLDRHDAGVRRRLRAQVPVSLHHAGEDAASGNRDSFMNLELPVEVTDPVERLDLISAQTRERKQLDDAEELYDLFHALGAVKSVGDAARRLAGSAREFSLSISNVPGPRDAVAVAGRGVQHLFSSSEPAAHHALRVSAISCAGDVGIGLCTDPLALPHIARMAEAVAVAHAELRDAAIPT